jgi:SAM-dependent methyltransferase
MSQTVAPVEISALERVRLDRLLSLLPRKDVNKVLEIGARHGVVTRLLAGIYDEVTALDLSRPPFHIDKVTTVQGDVQKLQFPDNSFDCVVCTEVLEHVPDFAAGAKEITRVSNSQILIGVPYRQDTRVGRTSCVHCRKISPPFGHINTFDEKKIERLFAGAQISSIEYVSITRERTNFLSTWLQDFARNPYGTYDQEEPCIHCGGKLERPTNRSFIRRLAGALGLRLYKLQYKLNRPRATWMLVRLQKQVKNGRRS